MAETAEPTLRIRSANRGNPGYRVSVGYPVGAEIEPGAIERAEMLGVEIAEAFRNFTEAECLGLGTASCDACVVMRAFVEEEDAENVKQWTVVCPVPDCPSDTPRTAEELGGH